MAARISARDKRNFTETLKAARIGVPESQYQVGLMYANGVGVDQDVEQAMSWLRQAAGRGLAAAQYLLGTRYATGSGTAQDDYQAVGWYLKAAEQGHAKALYRLGRLLDVPARDLSQACMARAAERGLAEAQCAVAGWHAAGQGVARDDARAADWYRLAAQQGLAEAQCALGDLFEQGQGVAQDAEEAIAWYRRAAAQHFPEAQVALERLDGQGGGRSGARSKPRRRPGSPDRRSDPAQWDKAAEQGDASSRYFLGLMFGRGLGVAQDVDKAQAWYLAAARQDDVRAQLALARLWEVGRPQRAVDWYRKAAEQGSAEAQFALGRHFCTGIVEAQDVFQGLGWYMRAGALGDRRALMTLGHMCSGSALDHMAVECFRKAAGLGDAEAQYLVGQHYATGHGIAQDHPAAVDWWTRSAEQGYAPAQCALGASCLAGKGIGKNFQQALRWFQKAADQGDAKAQWNLGAMYASGGEGQKQDLRQAFAWCRSAADLGFVPAQATLGVLFARIKDPVQAVVWWEKAALQGDPEAQFNLAVVCSKGLGVERDARRAFEWFARAAAQGVASAQSRLGLLYAVGEGVAEDPIEAHRWFTRAAAAGDAVAQTNLARSSARLTASQIVEAERRAKDSV